jgi:acyl carrier protein
MSNAIITKEEINAVFPKVAATVADALGRDAEEVKLDASLINDLGAESIDFLDIVFRLERAFKVKIPRGKIVEEARGDLSEAEFDKGGIVTDAGVQRLKAFLNEVPAERFPSPLKVADIPRLFTTETFCKMVIRQQRATPAAPAETKPA